MASSGNHSKSDAPSHKHHHHHHHQNMDPILRNAMRYTVSPREYKLLHKYLLARTPAVVKRSVPSSGRYEASVDGSDDYNASAFRVASRVFLASQAGLKIWDVIVEKVLSRGKVVAYVTSLFFEEYEVYLR
jgi:hypothetical protein